MAPTTANGSLALALVVSFTGACAPGTPEERAEAALTARATAIHERVLTLDTHIDIPLNFATRAVDPGVSGDFQVDLPKMRAGGLDAGFFIVYVGQTARTPENEAQAGADAMTKFEAIHRMAEELYPDEIEIAVHRGRRGSGLPAAASWWRRSASRTVMSSVAIWRCSIPTTSSARAT